MEANPDEPVVKVIKGLHFDTIVFWCPRCKTTHSLAVRKADDRKIPLECGYITSWRWNQNPVAPTVHGLCIQNGHCHSWIRDGFIDTSDDISHSTSRHCMLPVSCWPLRRPSDEDE